MKNLFKITDAKILVTIFLLFFTGLVMLALYTPKQSEQNITNQFTGIDASGRTYVNGNATGTIINH